MRAVRRLLGLLGVATAATVACGARTPVDLGESVAAGDDGAVDSGADAAHDAGVTDAHVPGADAAPDASFDARVDVGPESSTDRCPGGCPGGFHCDPSVGCVADVLAVTPSDLLGVVVPPAQVTTLGPTLASLTDIARHPDGTVYGISFAALYTVDPTTGATKLLADTGNAQLNALEAAPDGTLYVAGGQTLYTIEPSTGALTTVLGYPTGFSSSGDLAVVHDGTMFATASGATTADALLAIDLGTRQVTVVGSTGFECVYGLAAVGDALLGFTCSGDVIEIDPSTAAATLLGTTASTFYGACR
jgi:hypothetical protein